MTFKTRIASLIAGISLLVAMMLVIGWLAVGYMLKATDSAYSQGTELAHAIDTARSAQVNFQRQVQEWKNVLIRGGNVELRERHWKGFQEREALMDKERKELTASLGRIGGMQEFEAQANNIVREHGVLGTRYRRALTKYPNTIDSAAQQTIDVEVRGMDHPTSAGIDTMVDSLQKQVDQRFVSEAAAMRQAMQQRFLITSAIAAVLAAILLALVIAISRNVYNSLGADPETALNATARIAKGDLTQQLDAKTPTSLLGSLEMMQSRLRNIALASRDVATDIKNRSTALPATAAEREDFLNDAQRLVTAIDRLYISKKAR